MSATNCNWFFANDGIDQCSFINLDTKRAKSLRYASDRMNGE
jgi:hypothetical protein